MAVRVDAEELDQLDALVRTGVYRSRADVLREGLRRVSEERRRDEVARAYRRAYAAQPQAADDLGWVDEAAAATLRDVDEG